ncbi:MAG: DUF6089 family protein [Ferruginibacter sp.]|nr:hypothetical protein [Ferruginibacter sp.]
MKRIFFSFVIAMLFSTVSTAQMYFETVHNGEFGVTIGGAHYFGDLNNRAAFNRPRIAAGAFFRKQYGNYVSARVSAHFAQLGYSDIYSKSEFQRLRNLSFNTNIYEIALQGDFNFFKYQPENPALNFTPYVTIGIGAMNFDPYAYLDGQKYFLRQLGTEGQTSGYLGRKPYSTTTMVIPFGVGIKYNLTEKINISFEVAHRFTFTDYLDDVSKTYAGATSFQSGPLGSLSEAQRLQDRSLELTKDGSFFFKQSQQRGFSKQKDQYLIAEMGVSFNLTSYRCPPAN